jgi:transcriptional regulator with XRE-family HTH domain
MSARAQSLRSSSQPPLQQPILEDLAQQVNKTQVNLSTLRSDVLLKAIPVEACRLFKLDHGVLLIRRGKKGALVKVSEYVAEDRSETTIAVSSTVLNTVLETGEPFFSADALNDPRLSGKESVQHLDLRFCSALPIIGHEDKRNRFWVKGVLYLASFGPSKGPEWLTQEAFLSALRIFGAAVGLQLEEAGNHEEYKRIISSRDEFAYQTGVPIDSEARPSVNIGRYLYFLRILRKLSQRDVEKETDGIVTKTWLSRFERGENQTVESQRLRLIVLARLYGVLPEFLLALAGLPFDVPDLPNELEWVRRLLKKPEVLLFLSQLGKLAPDEQLLVLEHGRVTIKWLLTRGGEDTAAIQSFQQMVTLPEQFDDD